MAYTFFKAQGLEIGKSLLEADKVELAGQILAEVKKKSVNFLLPVDCSSRVISRTTQNAKWFRRMQFLQAGGLSISALRPLNFFQTK